MSSVSEFEAHGFHASLPKGRQSGQLRVSSTGLHFQCAGGQVNLPLNGLELRLGGAGNRLLFCTHPAQPDWQLYTADLGLLKAEALAGHPAVQKAGGARLRHHGRFWGALFGIAATLVLAVLLLWFSLDGLSTLAARQVPAEWERGLGERVMQQYRIGSEVLDKKETERLLGPLTAPLVAAVPGDRHRFEFHVVNNPAINAFALPGGQIAIHSELILRAQSAPELQGVLAHEIAHVTEQHGLRAVIRSTGLVLVAQALLGDASGLLAALANAGPLLINLSYSRRFEHEADEKGLALLLAANVNPKGLTDFFHTIQAEEKRQKDKLKEELPEEAGKGAEALESALGYLRTHPETPARIAALEQQIADAGARDWRNDEAAFRALQARVRQFVSDSQAEAAAE